jgi:hypothetical protein
MAQSVPLIRMIASHVYVDHDSQTDYKLSCPVGYIATGYSYKRQYASYDDTELHRNLVDRTNAVLNRNTLSDTAQLDGGGYAVSLLNIYHAVHDIEAIVTCLTAAATTDNALTLVAGNATAAPQSVGTATSFCSADFPVALGGFSNADAINLQDVGSAPVWGTSSNPVLLADLPDGQTGPPTGWQVKVSNALTSSAGIISYSICGKAPSLQTFVYSAPTTRGAFGSTNPFSIFAPVPDGWTAVGSGFDGGAYGASSAIDAWVQDGTIIDMQTWFQSTQGIVYDSGAAQVRAFISYGIDTRKGGGGSTAPGRAVAALLAVPQSGPPPSPTSVKIVEFYNSALDHYFITAFPDEIAKLDNGTFVGWTRTGQSFDAYGIGSTGRTSRHPVCREYGRPDVGIDSHFYSASPDECVATLINGGGAWVLEASEVFEMDLPDAVSGACPAGDVPVYRVWNQRLDSNHRYTTSTATRDQMVQKGGIAEGYGPNAVALCALP